MIEINREMFKSDPVFRKLYEIIKSNHKVAEHTKKNLLENKHIKDFCEEARHFVFMSGNIYLHYDVSSWYSNLGGALIKIESIGLYDNFMEYESARINTSLFVLIEARKNFLE